MNYRPKSAEKIKKLAKDLEQSILPWAEKCPYFLKKRIWPICLTNVAALNLLQPQLYLPITKVSLLVFAIDDLFDNQIFPIEMLKKYSEKILQVFAGDSISLAQNDPIFPLMNAIADTVNELSKNPIYSQLKELWIDGWKKFLEAMLQEYDWIHGKILPSYETYMETAIYSTGFIPFIRATFLQINDDSIFTCLPDLLTLEREAGICVRISNDLQSFTKELGEGKYNSLVIRQAEILKLNPNDYETTLKQAKELLIQELKEKMLHCECLSKKIHTRTQLPEQIIYDSAKVGFDFYMHHDFHTYIS